MTIYGPAKSRKHRQPLLVSRLCPACILITVLVFSALLSGCVNWVRDWPAVDGVVLDAETEQPIPGVVVEAVWEGGGHTTVCFHVENVYTDAQGRFRFPVWEVPDNRMRISNQQRRIRQFQKAGYRKSQRTYKEFSYKQGIYYLEKDTRSRTERLNSFRYPYICSYDEQNQWPMAKSLFLELETLGGDTRRLAASIEDSILDHREWSRVYTPEILDNAYTRIKQKIAEEEVQ